MRLQRSIKTDILLVFIPIILLVSASLVISQYYFGKELAIKATHYDFELIANSILKQNKIADGRIRNFLQANKNNSYLLQPIKFTYKHPALHDLIQLININNAIYSLYFTHDNGDFYELINMQASSLLYKKFQAPPSTQWLTIVSKDGKILQAFLDKNEKLLEKRVSSGSIDIKSRVWYKNALKTKDIALTGVYKFQSVNLHGFTYTVQLANTKRSIFAIDYTLYALEKLLHYQTKAQNAEVFIFDMHGKIVASSNKKDDQLIDKDLLSLLQQKKEQEIISYEHNNTGYLSAYQTLKNGMFLGLKVPSKPLFEPFVQNLNNSLLIAFLVLLISIPSLILVTNKIVEPIFALIKENKKIKKREFSDVKMVKTNIKEFQSLSKSLVIMSHSINSYQKSQADLLDSIVKLIAEAVDAKSHYTGGHCKRVPVIAEMLIDAASKTKDGPLKEFSLESEDEKKEFLIAAWLHDCGKVTTPEYVVDKATKLETIYNRIHEIRTRFEVLWRDAQIVYLQEKLSGRDEKTAKQTLLQTQQKLQDDFQFIAQCNVGTEEMSQEKIQHLQTIASTKWERNFSKKLGLGSLEYARYHTTKEQLPVKENLLQDNPEDLIEREYFDPQEYKKDGFNMDVPHYLYNYGELYNLSIQKGTLTQEERYKINEHVIMSIKMLEKIPFPSSMKKVPQFAGEHHETLCGTGYPKGLDETQLSIPSRVMAIADIFEALTASDRPYKKTQTLSQTLKIMKSMAQEKQIDPVLFELFVKEKIYLQYAKKYLKEEQLDEV